MDIFIEEMVKKKKDTTDYCKIYGVMLLAALLVFVIICFIMPLFPVFSSLIFLLAAGVVYGAYYLITSTNIEFEYSLVNTEIDIDKIINKKRRKRIATASIRGLDAMGTKNNPEFNTYLNNSVISKIYACIDKFSDNLFFIVYNQGDKKIMLVFNPSQKIVKQIVKYNPRIPLI